MVQSDFRNNNLKPNQIKLSPDSVKGIDELFTAPFYTAIEETLTPLKDIINNISNRDMVENFKGSDNFKGFVNKQSDYKNIRKPFVLIYLLQEIQAYIEFTKASIIAKKVYNQVSNNKDEIELLWGFSPDNIERLERSLDYFAKQQHHVHGEFNNGCNCFLLNHTLILQEFIKNNEEELQAHNHAGTPLLDVVKLMFDKTAEQVFPPHLSADLKEMSFIEVYNPLVILNLTKLTEDNILDLDNIHLRRSTDYNEDVMIDGVSELIENGQSALEHFSNLDVNQLIESYREAYLSEEDANNAVPNIAATLPNGVETLAETYDQVLADLNDQGCLYRLAHRLTPILNDYIMCINNDKAISEYVKGNSSDTPSHIIFPAIGYEFSPRFASNEILSQIASANKRLLNHIKTKGDIDGRESQEMILGDSLPVIRALSQKHTDSAIIKGKGFGAGLSTNLQNILDFTESPDVIEEYQNAYLNNIIAHNRDWLGRKVLKPVFKERASQGITDAKEAKLQIIQQQGVETDMLNLEELIDRNELNSLIYEFSFYQVSNNKNDLLNENNVRQEAFDTLVPLLNKTRERLSYLSQFLTKTEYVLTCKKGIAALDEGLDKIKNRNTKHYHANKGPISNDLIETSELEMVY